MKKYLIAGVGNILRGDDGVGIKVLEYLKGNLPAADFDFLEFASKSIDILNYLKNYPVTFIIDALDIGLPAGAVKLFGLEDISPAGDENKISSHSLSLKELRRLYRVLAMKNQVFVIGIQIKDLSFTEGLSPEVKAVFPAVLKYIKDRVNI